MGRWRLRPVTISSAPTLPNVMRMQASATSALPSTGSVSGHSPQQLVVVRELLELAEVVHQVPEGGDVEVEEIRRPLWLRQRLQK